MQQGLVMIRTKNTYLVRKTPLNLSWSCNLLSYYKKLVKNLNFNLRIENSCKNDYPSEPECSYFSKFDFSSKSQYSQRPKMDDIWQKLYLRNHMPREHDSSFLKEDLKNLRTNLLNSKNLQKNLTGYKTLSIFFSSYLPLILTRMLLFI